MSKNNYLHRCIQLASLGGVGVLPNPQVGAVVVRKGQVIGEGYYEKFGGPHAEVNAIEGIRDKSILDESTLYVSLEPCNIFGKTPPCTDLIIRHRIPKVVVGSLDPNPKISGRGVAKLRAAGVEVEVAEDQLPFAHINAPFFVNQQLERPYICLKWAESKDGFIAGKDDSSNQAVQVQISGPQAGHYAHKLRSKFSAILVGRTTAAIDDPSLTTRKFYGPDPLRIILDPGLKLPSSLKVFTDGKATLVINHLKSGQEGAINFWKMPGSADLRMLLKELYSQRKVYSILVEGGAQVLQQFLDANLWDEIHHIQSDNQLGKGVDAPRFIPSNKSKKISLGKDIVDVYTRLNYKVLTA